MTSMTNDVSADAPPGEWCERFGVNMKLSLSTYTEVSKDTAQGCSMVTSSCPVINFDDVAGQHVKARGYQAKFSSNDALYLEGEDKKPWFIEFKNGRIEFAELRQKVTESLLIAMDIGVLRDLNDAQQRAEYILVYNPDNNQRKRNSLLQHAMHPSSRPYLHPKVQRFTWLFKEVHSYTPDEFRTHFLNVKYQKEETTL